MTDALSRGHSVLSISHSDSACPFLSIVRLPCYVSSWIVPCRVVFVTVPFALSYIMRVHKRGGTEENWLEAIEDKQLYQILSIRRTLYSCPGSVSCSDVYDHGFPYCSVSRSLGLGFRLALSPSIGPMTNSPIRSIVPDFSPCSQIVIMMCTSNQICPF